MNLYFFWFSFTARKFLSKMLISPVRNPHVVVYLKPRRHRSPVLVAEYLNGEKHTQSLHNYGVDKVPVLLCHLSSLKVLEIFLTTRGSKEL